MVSVTRLPGVSGRRDRARRLTSRPSLLTVRGTMTVGARELGWNDAMDEAWIDLGSPGVPARVARLDRGWSTVLTAPDASARVRNIGADVAVGDWVVPSDDGERVDRVLPRQSAFVRRASFEGMRAEAHTLASNIDVVFLVHSLLAQPNQRRLERELVLAFDSGASPAILLTKLDAVDDPAFVDKSVESLEAVAVGVPVLVVSGTRGDGVEGLREFAAGNRSIALLGASGVGKSTLVNKLVGGAVQRVSDVRAGDNRGRHTTTAAELVRIPTGGWLIDTPGLRAVSLWSSGHGIERAFADVFDLMDDCRFRDCKHDQEPGCAVQGAITAGTLDPARLVAMERLVAEEASIEDEQRARLRAEDRRGFRKRTPKP